MEFSEMKLDKKLLDGIKLMGISIPTPIQEKCIPEIKKGRDVVGQSLTGSGKTAAFGLPILEKILPGNGIQALILTPTRELCGQVRDHLEQMARFLPINVISIYGGVGFFQQMEDIKIAEVVVATPGRLLDHLGRGNIKLHTVKFVVLDEGDKMFEMGFEEDVDRILKTTPHTRQTVMFSATMPRAAQNIIKKYLKNPVFVTERLQVDKSLLKQVFYSIRREEKFSLLVHLLKNKTAGPAIVFCGTKRTVDNVAHKLHRQKVEAMPVHGDLRQSRRQLAVNLFKQAKIDVLVATDVAARGLDIKDVTHVYNYDVPRTHEEYTHRIGRTARAGKKGDAVTLLSERDYDNFGKILKFGRLDIKQEQVPEFEMVEETSPFQRQNKLPSHRQQQGGSEMSYGRQYEESRFGQQKQGRGEERQTHYSNQRNDYSQRRNYSEKSNYPQRQNYSQQNNYSQRSNYPQQNNYSKRNNYSRDSYNNKRSYGGVHHSFTPQVHSPMDFGHKKHEANKWVEQKNQRTAEQSETYYHNEIKPGLDITPRTHEPLFPTSHYNPDYKKYKEAVKKQAPLHKEPTHSEQHAKSFNKHNKNKKYKKKKH